MLQILGSRQPLRSGPSRRDRLQVGDLGVFGLKLGDYLRLHSARAKGQPAAVRGAGFGYARARIPLCHHGRPSQFETFDVKPDAPRGIRGTPGTISISFPGHRDRLGELLPQLAWVVNKVGVSRSQARTLPVHGVACATIGVRRRRATDLARAHPGNRPSHAVDRSRAVVPRHPRQGAAPGSRSLGGAGNPRATKAIRA